MMAYGQVCQKKNYSTAIHHFINQEHRTRRSLWGLLKMTKHINPGTDTTINPVVIDDSYRERKQPQPQRCTHEQVCKEYREWYETAKEIDSVCPYTMDCPHHRIHTSAPSQQRIDAAIAYCNQRHFEVEDDDGTIYEVIPKGEIIALLQAGGGK